MRANEFINTDCSNVRVITGLSNTMDDTQKKWIEINPENIFTPKKGWENLKPKYFEYSSTGPDWALLPVQPITKKGLKNEISPIKIDTYTVPQIEDDVTCIGHALGLPIAVSTGKVIRNGNSHYIECNFAAFSGNSGSPVMLSSSVENNQAIGILVRGTRQLQKMLNLRMLYS